MSPPQTGSTVIFSTNWNEKLKISKGKFVTYKLAWNEIEHLSLQQLHIQKYVDW